MTFFFKKSTSFSLYFSIFREYIAYEFSLQVIPINWFNIELTVERKIPQQTNGFDCGIFVCEYAENISRKSNFNFTQKDTDFIRERIKTEIMLGTLIPDPLNMC